MPLLFLSAAGAVTARKHARLRQSGACVRYSTQQNGSVQPGALQRVHAGGTGTKSCGA